MDTQTALDTGRQVLMLVLLIALPLLMVGLVVGVSVSLIQAVTQVQEMTLTFVPKIVAVFVGLVVFLPFMIRTITDFGHGIFDRIVSLGVG